MNKDESYEDLYRRLTALGVALKDLGSEEVNDKWVKRKFIQAIMPFEENTTKIIRQRSDFKSMTSNDVLSEFHIYEDLGQECR